MTPYGRVIELSSGAQPPRFERVFHKVGLGATSVVYSADDELQFQT